MDLKNTRCVEKKYYWQYDNTNQEIHADVCTSSWTLGALSRSGKSGRGYRRARDSLAILQQAYWNLSFYVWNNSRPCWRLVDKVVDLPTIMRNAKCEMWVGDYAEIFARPRADSPIHSSKKAWSNRCSDVESYTGCHGKWDSLSHAIRKSRYSRTQRRQYLSGWSARASMCHALSSTTAA